MCGRAGKTATGTSVSGAGRRLQGLPVSAQELRIPAGEAVSATGNGGRLERYEGQGDSQSGFCASMSGLQAPWAEVQWTIGEGWRLPVEMGRVAAVRWRVRKRRGAFKWLDGA